MYGAGLMNMCAQPCEACCSEVPNLLEMSGASWLYLHETHTQRLGGWLGRRLNEQNNKKTTTGNKNKALRPQVNRAVKCL